MDGASRVRVVPARVYTKLVGVKILVLILLRMQIGGGRKASEQEHCWQRAAIVQLSHLDFSLTKKLLLHWSSLPRWALARVSGIMRIQRRTSTEAIYRKSNDISAYRTLEEVLERSGKSSSRRVDQSRP